MILCLKDMPARAHFVLKSTPMAIVWKMTNRHRRWPLLTATGIQLLISARLLLMIVRAAFRLVKSEFRNKIPAISIF